MDAIPFGEYRPDVSDFNNGYTANISNVIPRGDGYGPFPSWQVLTQTLPGACRGGFYGRKTDGTVAVFAATSTRLYLLNNTTLAWSDVSKGGSPYTIIPSSGLWQFAQFNNYIIAVQASCSPQYYDLTSSVAFADLPGSPPAASYVSVVSRFVLLSGLVSLPYRIQWSGLNDPTNWTAGVNSSDFQDFPDGGIVRGAVGGDFGYVFQDQAIRQMVFAPGSDIIFSITKAAQDVGLGSPYALVAAGEDIHFYSTKGFMKLSGGALIPIGRERVDRTFSKSWDNSAPQLMMGAHAPESGRVFWVYRSSSSGASGFDSGFTYDSVLDRWTPFSTSGQYLLSMSQPGMTLESLDTIQSNIDLFPFSLDSVPGASSPKISMFDGTGALGFFNGPNLEAILETGEQSAVKKRMFCQGFYPLTDAGGILSGAPLPGGGISGTVPAVMGCMTKRENLNVTPSQTIEQPMNGRGFVPSRADTRHGRFCVRVQAGTIWTYAMGVDPLVTPRGKR